MSEETNSYLTKLGGLFNESGGEIIERAVRLLFDNQEEEIKKDNAARLGRIKKS